MPPKLWPKRFQYARESCSPEIAYCIIQEYLRSPIPEDLYKTSKVIEEKRVHPHLEIKKINSSLKINGRLHPLADKTTLLGHANYGVFASEKIDVNAEIGEYVGELFIINSERVQRPRSEYRWAVLINNAALEIDAQKVANELALINDYRGLSCTPNVEMALIIHKGYMYFGYVACRNINKGEELLVNYGEAFWNFIRKGG